MKSVKNQVYRQVRDKAYGQIMDRVHDQVRVKSGFMAIFQINTKT